MAETNSSIDSDSSLQINMQDLSLGNNSDSSKTSSEVKRQSPIVLVENENVTKMKNLAGVLMEMKAKKELKQYPYLGLGYLDLPRFIMPLTFFNLVHLNQLENDITLWTRYLPFKLFSKPNLFTEEDIKQLGDRYAGLTLIMYDPETIRIIERSGVQYEFSSKAEVDVVTAHLFMLEYLNQVLDIGDIRQLMITLNLFNH